MMVLAYPFGFTTPWSRNSFSGMHVMGFAWYNLETLRLTFVDMPEARRRKLLGLNAARL